MEGCMCGRKSKRAQATAVQKFLAELAKIADGDGHAYDCLSDFFSCSAPHVFANRECMLAAVEKIGFALVDAAEPLTVDREIVLAAVSQDGLALEYAANALKADKEVVLAAVANNVNAFQHAAVILKSDKDIVLEVAKHLLGSLPDRDWNVRKDAAQKLAAMLRDADVDIRCFAADALRNVAEALNNGTDESHQTIANVVQALAAALKDRNHFVRQRAATALGTVGSAAAIHIPQLNEASKDENVHGRQAAILALAVVRVEKVALDTSIEDGRNIAAEVVPVLRAALNAFAVTGLGKVMAALDNGSQTASQVVWELAAALKEALNDGTEKCRQTAAEVARVLAVAAEDSDELVRHNAAVALGKTGIAAESPLLVSKVTPVLVAALQDNTESRREAAARVLQKLICDSAESGNLAACSSMAQMGVPIEMFRQALFIAKEAGHKHMVEYLEKKLFLKARWRCGSGDAYATAMHDDQAVEKVAWYVVPLDGKGAYIGVMHSLLALKVVSGRIYTLEKAQVANNQEEQFKNGIFVSRWEEVSGHLGLQEPWHVTHGSAACGITMPALREVAASLGPYDIGSCNCHHCAIAVFNHCAKAFGQNLISKNEMPNLHASRFAGRFTCLGLSSAAASISNQSSPGTSFQATQPEQSASASTSNQSSPGTNCNHKEYGPDT